MLRTGGMLLQLYPMETMDPTSFANYWVHFLLSSQQMQITLFSTLESIFCAVLHDISVILLLISVLPGHNIPLNSVIQGTNREKDQTACTLTVLSIVPP